MDDTPRSYPSWRFWQDGRTTIVQSPAELAALPPGHAGSPAGPFPVPEPPEPPEQPEPDEENPEEPVGEEEPEEPEALTTESLREQARVLRGLGQSVRQIADTLHRSPRTVGRWLEE